jgi:steroid 5-alpha reductase family enzyme
MEPDPMSVAAAMSIAFVILVTVFAVFWAWQLKSANAGMIDPVWAFSLGSVAVFYGVVGDADPLTRMLVAAGGGIWGVRLGWHLWRRNAGKPEDPRYRRFREQWGAAAGRKMFWFLEFQTVVSLMLSLAFAVPAWRVTPLSPAWAALSVAIWLVSVSGEALADNQLRRFIAAPENRGEVCRVGLWRYSRHPNYFFECVHWLAYMALSAGSPWLWLTLIPPALMAFLLLKLSGVPMLEARLIASRAGYAAYVRETSALIPWPPRRR